MLWMRITKSLYRPSDRAYAQPDTCGFCRGSQALPIGVDLRIAFVLIPFLFDYISLAVFMKYEKPVIFEIAVFE